MALPSPMTFPQVQQAPSVLSLQEQAQEKVRQSECPATAVVGHRCCLHQLWSHCQAQNTMEPSHLLALPLWPILARGLPD